MTRSDTPICNAPMLYNLQTCSPDRLSIHHVLRTHLGQEKSACAAFVTSLLVSLLSFFFFFFSQISCQFCRRQKGARNSSICITLNFVLRREHLKLIWHLESKTCNIEWLPRITLAWWRLVNLGSIVYGLLKFTINLGTR